MSHTPDRALAERLLTFRARYSATVVFGNLHEWHADLLLLEQAAARLSTPALDEKVIGELIKRLLDEAPHNTFGPGLREAASALDKLLSERGEGRAEPRGERTETNDA